MNATMTDKLSARQRRTMAPWGALVVISASSMGALLVFSWNDKPLDDAVRYALIAAFVVPLYAVAGGEVSDVAQWLRSKVSGRSSE